MEEDEQIDKQSMVGEDQVIEVDGACAIIVDKVAIGTEEGVADVPTQGHGKVIEVHSFHTE